jgi:hypothetical protein
MEGINLYFSKDFKNSYTFLKKAIEYGEDMIEFEFLELLCAMSSGKVALLEEDPKNGLEMMKLSLDHYKEYLEYNETVSDQKLIPLFCSTLDFYGNGINIREELEDIYCWYHNTVMKNLEDDHFKEFSIAKKIKISNNCHNCGFEEKKIKKLKLCTSCNRK